VIKVLLRFSMQINQYLAVLLHESCIFSVNHSQDLDLLNDHATTSIFFLVSHLCFLSFDFLPVPFAGDPAREVLKDACQNLMVMCQHVRSTLDKAVDDYRSNPIDMDTK